MHPITKCMLETLGSLSLIFYIQAPSLYDAQQNTTFALQRVLQQPDRAF